MISFIGSTLIVNRWLFTELKLLSFGRLWPYYVSYLDFGLVRRAFLGTLIDIVNADGLFSNKFVIPYVLHFSALCFLYIVFARRLASVTLDKQTRIMVGIVLFFSPFFLFHFAYSTGTLDIYVFAWFIGCLLVKTYPKFSFLIISGVLLHEAFIFLLPAIFVYKILNCKNSNQERFKVIRYFFSSIIVSGLLLAFTYFNKVQKSKFDLIMSQKIPTELYLQNAYLDPSGYFEINSDFGDNVTLGSKAIHFIVNNRLVVPVLSTLLALYLAWLVSYSWKQITKMQRHILMLSLSVPLLIQVVAGDLFRWVALSASCSLTFLVFGLRDSRIKLHLRHLVPLLPLSILGPIGSSDFLDPFPVITFFMMR